MDPIVQVSIDLMTLEDALPVAEIAVEAGVDWLEVGTPLILGEGLHAVRAFRERWPDHKVVADLKTMDAGYLEAEMMAKAGADLIVVMAAAHWSTVQGACRAAKDYGVQVMGDIMLAEDKPACARQMQELGVDYVIVHTGFAISVLDAEEAAETLRLFAELEAACRREDEAAEESAP